MTDGGKCRAALNERDSLQDMLYGESELAALYAEAVCGSGAKSLRNAFAANFAAAAEAQYELLTLMTARGYLSPSPADGEAVKRAADTARKIIGYGQVSYYRSCAGGHFMSLKISISIPPCDFISS